MEANILPLYHPTLGMGLNVKFQLFQNIVMLHIKLKGITKCSNIVGNILPANPLPHDPKGWVKRSKFIFFSENGHVVYQVKRNHEMQ